MIGNRLASRRLPIGAEPVAGEGVSFRVWAPKCRRVDVILQGGGAAAGRGTFPLEQEGEYFSGFVPGAAAGSRYSYRLDEGTSFPDPASRFQPDGVDGLSEVVDPCMYRWTDAAWRGVTVDRQVIYEMHVGTFTREGTWRAAERELPVLAALGVTVLELMPVAEFPGRFGWGYDGVFVFAPTRLYGGPDDFRRFVDRAHALGLAVILDVVYNHLGPDGNSLTAFSDDYFTDRYETEWGQAINFDGPSSGPVREFFVTNAGYWVDEYHLDGLRFDATQSIFDSSPQHVIAAIGRRAREAAAPRSVILVAENEPQHVQLVRPLGQGGYGLDALWNDDLHHSAIVAVTGRREAYYSDHLGAPQELISAAKRGYLFQGQRYAWQKKPRGTPAFGIQPAALVTYLQNHDQVANSARGLRLHALTSPGRLRAITAFVLLAPGTPMLFQGQELAASQPFLYFSDHRADLAERVRNGRVRFLAQFPSVTSPDGVRPLEDPADPRTFERCKLALSDREREPHARVFALHRDLLKLRREDPAFNAPRPGGVDGAVIGPEAFLLRFFTSSDAVARHEDRLLLVNLGRDLDLSPAPEPLLAPPEGMHWGTLWSSEAAAYGGMGTPPVELDGGWHVPGHAAVVLAPAPLDR